MFRPTCLAAFGRWIWGLLWREPASKVRPCAHSAFPTVQGLVLTFSPRLPGQYEERIKSVIDECEKAENGVILFIDEVHLLMAGQGSSGGGMDAANLLKPAMARGRIRVIAATTLNEYRQHIEKDAALERRFQQVIVNEPSVPSTISILRGIKEKYEVSWPFRTGARYAY